MDDDLKKLEAENRRLKSAIRELAVLNEISNVINSTMPVEEISRRIMRKVVDALEASEAAVHTFSDEGQLAPTTFVRQKLDETSIAKARLDIKITGWIAKFRKPLLINDVAADERFKGANLGTTPVTSLLSVPLTAKGKLIGALTAFNSRKSAGFGQDDIRLLGIIGVQSAQIIENARLYQEELKLRQLEGELTAAQKIQTGFLPVDFPRIDGYDIYGGSIAAKEVGGDYFDFILPRPGRLFFTLGDVSGKGLPAALLMSTIQGQVRLLVNRNPDIPAPDILRELNLITCQLSGRAQFATMIVGRIEGDGKSVTFANGGHNYPVQVKADGSLSEITESSTLVGMFEEVEFVEAGCSMENGDLLAIASDGIDEALNEEEIDFGLDRFKSELVNCRDMNAEDIYHHIVTAVEKFRGKAEPSDDITLIIIKKIPA